MKKVIDEFITFILVIMIIIIFLGTIYFCLDVFGIITVPAKYSIANLFYSQIEIIASGESIAEENIIKDDYINKIANSKVPENNINDEIEVVEVDAPTVDPLTTLKELQERQKENQLKNEIKVDDCERLYYSQLDTYGKMIYDKLYENMDKLKTGTYTAEFDTQFNDLLHQENGTNVLNNSFQLAINALTFDNPQLFYIDVTKMYLLTEITTRAFSKTYRVSIGGNGNSYLFEEFNSEDAVDTAINNVKQIKDDIIRTSDSDNVVDKIKVVHDYLVDTVEYDSTAGENIYNIYGTLVNKRAVCEGYARTCKYILDDLGIPCVIACGIGTNSAGNTESHAWNYIQIDDKWYALDVTWDDPVIIGNGNINKERRYSYFLNGSNDFFKDHYEDGNVVGDFNFKYPTLSEENY